MVSFCSATYPYGLFFSHIILSLGENSFTALMSSGEIQSCFKAVLIDIATSDHFLLSAGYIENLYYSATQNTPPNLCLGPPVLRNGVRIRYQSSCLLLQEGCLHGHLHSRASVWFQFTLMELGALPSLKIKPLAWSYDRYPTSPHCSVPKST